MSELTLSIVILNYNAKSLLRLCLKNLLDLKLPFPFEIIVVDNASRDGSEEWMKQQYPQKAFPNIQYIQNSKNLGYAAGNNIGIKQAKGRYILILNYDVIFGSAQEVVRCIQYLEEHPEVGMLGPKLLNTDGSVQHSCYRPYTTFTPLYRRTPLGRLPWAQQDLARHLMFDFDHLETRSVDWLMSSCVFIPKAVFEHIGYFNERFFLYFSDFELCDRLAHHGWKVIYFPEVTAIHYHRRVSASGSQWGGLTSMLNYTTRVHVKDWVQYLKQRHAHKHASS